MPKMILYCFSIVLLSASFIGVFSFLKNDRKISVPTAEVEDQNAKRINFSDRVGRMNEDLAAGVGSSPETILDFSNIHLKGVFASDVYYLDAAIIEIGNNQVLVRVGRFLGEGFFLDNVESNYVVLSNGKETKEIRFSNYSVFHGEDRAVESETPDRLKISEREKAISYFALEPVSSGKAQGYKVTKGSNVLKSKFGLKPGDVIYSANGYPLGTESSDVLAKKSFNDLGKVDFLIKREEGDLLVEYIRN